MSSLPQHFEIRSEPKPNGHIIAIWRKENDNHQLIFGVKDVVTGKKDCTDDDERTWARDDERAVVHDLLNQITEPEFSVHDEMAEIPHIVSDGVLHHLGVLKWSHEWHAFTTGWHHVERHGRVYAKVVDLEAQDIIDKLKTKPSESSDSVS